MSTTSQPTTFSDLYGDLISRVRLATGVTATDTLAKRHINTALQDMHMGGIEYKFPWAERRATIRTQERYTTGTIVATRGSATITGTGTAWNTNNDFSVKNMRANGRIVIAGSRTPYQISAVASDTSATLTTAFTEATVTDGTYVYFEDEYDLASDFLRPIDLRRFSTPGNIVLINRNQARLRYPTNSLPGTPREAAIFDFAPSGNTTPIRRVALYPPPSTYALIPYSYITNLLVTSSAGVAQTGFSADSDEPTMPLRYRHIIVLHGLYNWYRDRKDDTRAGEAKGEYTDAMARMLLDVEVGGQRPQMRPDVSRYVRKARNPYSAGRRRFDRGNFDFNGE
jgi:hypothetical protein